jgi:hypothetical protein
MRLLDELIAYGHPNVLSTHPTTLEFTKEDFLTPTGDCILGIRASKSCSDLNPALKNAIQTGELIRVELLVNELSEIFEGRGNPELTLANSLSMVFRKSTFISDRTILCLCNKAAKDLSRVLVQLMKNPNQQITVRFYG